MEPAELQVLLTEYEKAQDSAQYHDGEVWSVCTVTWAAMLILLGFVMGNVSNCRLRPLLTVLSVLGVLLVVLQWEVQRWCRIVKNQKYKRCRDIEEQLGMHQHRGLEYPPGRFTLLFRVVSLFFLAAWGAVLYMVFWQR